MSDDAKPVPTLFEWMGGMLAIERLMTLFYRRVPEDVLLASLFAHMPPEHVEHVARFVAEVLGGPKTYSAELGGHPAMIRKHLGRALTEEQRQRWMNFCLAERTSVACLTIRSFALLWSPIWSGEHGSPSSTRSPEGTSRSRRPCLPGAGASWGHRT